MIIHKAPTVNITCSGANNLVFHNEVVRILATCSDEEGRCIPRLHLGVARAMDSRDPLLMFETLQLFNVMPRLFALHYQIPNKLSLYLYFIALT